jgi:hypothetical protein
LAPHRIAAGRLDEHHFGAKVGEQKAAVTTFAPG